MNDIVALIKEINQLEYEVNVKLRYEYDDLIDEQITDKQSIIMDIIRHNANLTASDIAERLSITTSAVSQLLTALEKKSYIKRSINPHNRRELIIELTERAEQYFQNIEKVELGIIEKYYAQLSIEELQQLRDIFAKLHSIVMEQNKKER